jgi:hypothetical protein
MRQDMKTALLTFSILFCCAFNVSAQQKETASLNKARSDIYQVYKVVLKELFLKPQFKPLAIRSLTSGTSSSNPKAIEKHNLISLVQEYSPGESEIVDNYQALNQKSSELKNEFDLEVPTILLNEKRWVELFNEIKAEYPKDKVDEKFREVFNQRYKGIAITFSNIGFNKERNQALLHVEFDTGGSHNGCLGEYVFLIKESNGWIVKKELLSWIS